MSMTDPIADMLTRIRNAISASFTSVDIPSSGLKIDIAKVLKSEGFIKNYKIIPDKCQGVIRIFFKLDEKGCHVIEGLKRVSKPGCRIYCKKDSVPKVLNGLGILIVSTSSGIATGRKCEDLGIGGEVLCQIW